MNKALVRVGLYLDRQRIKHRFERVERQLRERDVKSWPEDLQQNRVTYLNLLHRYWRRGRFPRNYDRLRHHAPCFIDRDGTVCAVAHLLIASGQGELAQRVARDANYATVREMTFSELDRWAAKSGLTRDELALIQPTYPGDRYLQELGYGLLLSRSIILLGGAIFAGNIVFNLKNHRLSNRGFYFALIAGVILIATALYRFYRINNVLPFLFIGSFSARTDASSDIYYFNLVLTCGLLLTLGSLSFILFNYRKAKQRKQFEVNSVG